MVCPHCAFSCTEDGEDMSRETLNNALNNLNKTQPTIGGGEPTCHLDFEYFLQTIMDHPCSFDSGYGPDITINGKDTKRGRLVLSRSKAGGSKPLRARLSLDRFHEKIDSNFIEEWKNSGELIADAMDHSSPVPVGRGKNISNTYPQYTCVCPHAFVRPSGMVRRCGCLDSPIIGSVNESGLIQALNSAPQCHRVN